MGINRGGPGGEKQKRRISGFPNEKRGGGGGGGGGGGRGVRRTAAWGRRPVIVESGLEKLDSGRGGVGQSHNP